MVLNSIWDAIYSIWNHMVYAISNMRIPFDIIDILVIAYVIYKTIAFLRETRAGQLVKGLAVLFIVYLIANWCDLVVLEWTLSRVVDSIIIIAVVVFQPELRRILEKVGRTGFRTSQLLDGQESELVKCIDVVSRAAGTMQEKKIGALIVFEKKTQLGDIIDTGTVVDAAPSVSMVNNIFFPKSPLHDGAMIIRDSRVYAAGCILPLTQRDDISLQLGTRHRAAIGMSENSDAVVVVVSEETGNISVVTDGNIRRDFNAITIREELRRLLLEQQEKKKDSTVVSLLKRAKILKSRDEGKEESEI